MRNEYLTLSPVAAFGLVAAGFMFGLGITAGDAYSGIAMCVVSGCFFIVARQDARQSIEPGHYSRTGLFWRRTDGEVISVRRVEGRLH